MQAASADVPAAPSEVFGATRKVVLAGQPRSAAARGEAGAVEVHHPKEVLLALARGWAAAAGAEPVVANPHFMPIAEWSRDLLVLHFSSLDLACPVPLARNVMVVDGEDLVGLAEERRSGDRFGLRQRRLELMDRILALTPAAACGSLLPQDRAEAVPIAPLLAHAGSLAAESAGPVRWLACDLETGPYNFLQLRRDPKLGTSHVPVLFKASSRGGRPALVAFATPGTLGDLGPALRAFRALEQEGAQALLFVFFFGSPEEFAASLQEHQHAVFFGDNFRSSGIRFLFAPFVAADLLQALRGAAATIDTCYGGLLDALARGLGLGQRLVIGPDGSFDAWRNGQAVVAGIAWESVLDGGALSRRRHKVNRAGERELVSVLAGML